MAARVRCPANQQTHLWYLASLLGESGRTFTDPIRAYLEALGFVDGRNIELDFRHADGNVGRLPMIATELVARRPAVIATFGDATGLAAQRAATVIPIVAMSEDLVQAKLVKDRGANITGVSIMGTELDAKRLELLAEVLPPPAPYCSFLIQRHIASRDRLSIPLRRHSALPWRKPPLRQGPTGRFERRVPGVSRE